MMNKGEAGSDRIVSFCNDLLAFEYVAIGGYESAIEGLHVKYPAIAEKLIEFLGEHQRHVRDLEGIVYMNGGEPRKTPGIQVIFKKPLMELKKLQGGEAILGAMVSNEESAATQYDSAQNEALDQKFPQAVIDVCRRALEDERRHLAYVVEQYESFRTGTKIGTEERRPHAPPRAKEKGFGGAAGLSGTA